MSRELILRVEKNEVLSYRAFPVMTLPHVKRIKNFSGYEFVSRISLKTLLDFTKIRTTTPEKGKGGTNGPPG